ncbi:MAG: N-acetylneuraminate synthase [Omnitrophica bacterium]|nr:N-acetylneuraminate synthase [Candidatus Omnitrophota bacterium]
MHFNKRIKIGDFTVSEDSRTFIIAEAGVNHNGDMDIAERLIDCAVRAKADAVKFQAFKAERLILRNAPKAPYQLQTTDSSESQFEMLEKLEVTKEQSARLKGYCENKGIIFLITPFDESSLEELDDLDPAAYKVSSTDITNFPFLKRIAKKQKPVILSTGMAYLSEVRTALSSIFPFTKDLILLQCTANYPVPDEEVNLRVLDTYREEFDILIGYSDHSAGIGAGAYAVAKGAKVIEKHFTLDKKFTGPDHRASLSPVELEQFVREIRKAERYLGLRAKAPTPSELKTRKLLLKYLVTARSIKKGEVFTAHNIAAKRTGGRGIAPIYSEKIIGREADRAYEKNEILETRLYREAEAC